MKPHCLLDTISLEPDPVIEHYKRGIDRTLLRANLRLSYAERLRRLEELYRFSRQLRQAGKRLRLEGKDVSGAAEGSE